MITDSDVHIIEGTEFKQSSYFPEISQSHSLQTDDGYIAIVLPTEESTILLVFFPQFLVMI